MRGEKIYVNAVSAAAACFHIGGKEFFLVRGGTEIAKKLAKLKLARSSAWLVPVGYGKGGDRSACSYHEYSTPVG